MEYLVLEMPIFNMDYECKNLGYSDSVAKTNLKKELKRSSQGYCMYCYSRIVIDGRENWNLEHAIEKMNSSKLENCVPNIGVACLKCNNSFKRIGENKRKLTPEIIGRFEQQCECEKNKPECNTKPCEALLELQKSYGQQESGHIILQPTGIVGACSKEPLNIQYDVIRSEFQPATHYHHYSDEEIDFINDHIQRFRLNDTEYRTKSVRKYAKNIIDTNGKITPVDHSNMASEMFMRALQKRKRPDRVKICKAVYRAGLI